jgi:hypothetical protein
VARFAAAAVVYLPTGTLVDADSTIVGSSKLV